MARGREIKVAILGDARGFKSALDDAAGAAKGFGSKVAGLAKAGALAGGAVIGGALTKGVLDAMDIEAANDRLASQLGLTAEDAASYGRLAGKLYADAYGGSIEEVNMALGSVGSSLAAHVFGDEAALERLTVKALDFASAFEIDVNRAVNSVGIVLNSGLASDADEAFDLIVSAAQKVPAALREDLLDATDEYSQFFNQLGIDGPTAFGLLVNASADGMYGIDKVGDALKELTIRSTDMSTASVDAYKAAGLSAEKMAARFLAGGEDAAGAFEDLIDGLLSIKDPVKQANAAIGLFGTPLEDLNVGEIPDFLRGMKDAGSVMGDFAGSADRMGETLNDNLKTKLESFKRKGLMALAQVASKYLIPAIETAADWIGKRMPGFIARAQQAFDRVRPTIEALIPAFGQIVAMVQEKWPEIQRTIESVLEAVAEVVADVVSAVTALWDNFGNNILEFVQRVWPRIQQVIEGALEIIRGVVKTVTSLIKGDWSGVWEGIKGIVSGVWHAIQGIVGGALEVLRSTIGGALEVIGSVIKGAWDGIVSTVSGLPGRISSAASGMWDGIKNAFRSAINWIIRAWNGLEFEIPGFDPPGPGPKFGGFTLGVPNIPELAQGGIVPGALNQPQLILAHGGEKLLTHGQQMRAGSAAVAFPTSVTLVIDGQQFAAKVYADGKVQASRRGVAA